MILGDLKARHESWNDNKSNFRGKQLHNWLTNYSLEYKCEVKKTREPTFPESNAYIDFAIVDIRLKFTNTNLSTLHYDSDHNAIEATLILNQEIEHSSAPQKKIYLYKKINWDKFNKALNKNYDSDIPDDRNLTVEAMDTYIEKLQVAIEKSIEESTPILKFRNRIEKFNNEKILKLYDSKHNLQTHIHRLIHKKDTESQVILEKLQAQMKITKENTKSEFRISSNNSWNNEIKSVDYRESAKFSIK